MNPPRPRVLYITGAGRSGSTILGAILGSQPGIVATGELDRLLWDDLGASRICACTRRVPDCPLWGPALQRWSGDLSPHQLSDYLRLQNRLERFRGLPFLMWHSSHRSASFENYIRWTTDLLSAIVEIGSGEIVADSAKNPVRALALLRGGTIDMTLIHLVRDPRGVAWSMHKRLRRQGPANRHPVAVVLRAGLDWTFANRFSEIVASSYETTPYVRIRYEDLVRDPARVLGRIGQVAGLDLAPLGGRAASGEVFSFGHIMAGNRAREGGPRPLAIDVDWEENSPRWIRWTTWALTGWLARRYGYR